MEINPKIEVFDMPHAVSLAEVKKNFLDIFLPSFIKKHELRTSLDIGCGFGYFSRYLKDLGLEVAAFDGRPENVRQAQIRHPDINFEVHNVEDPSVIMRYGQFDLVICLGLLYHLENPFLGIRNLSSLTRKMCLIETMISPFTSPVTALVKEGRGIDQGLDYIAQVPSESWLVKVLHRTRFQFIYETTVLPKHKDFCSSLIKKRARKFIIASKESLSHPLLKEILEPKETNRYMWYNFGLGHLLEWDGLKKVLKAGLKLLGN